MQSMPSLPTQPSRFVIEYPNGLRQILGHFEGKAPGLIAKEAGVMVNGTNVELGLIRVGPGYAVYRIIDQPMAVAGEPPMPPRGEGQA